MPSRRGSSAAARAGSGGGPPPPSPPPPAMIAPPARPPPLPPRGGGGGAPRPPPPPPRRRPVAREAPVDPAAEADRPRTAPHQHPPVVRRAEVVQEHAAVEHGLPAHPADPLQELRHRLGQDNVGAEVRPPPADRPPAGHPGVRSDDDLGRAHPAARGRDAAAFHAHDRR